jgi:hypothetical protein
MKYLAIPLALLLAACGQSADMAAMPAGAPEPMAMDRTMIAPEEGVAASEAAAPEQAAPKYLAERQFWVFELPENEIEARWQAHVALCKADCEVLNAALNKSAHSPVSASLQIRVGRASADRLIAAMSSPDISERRVEREDKTLQVVDVEARMKNLVELRDRLRALLVNRSGPLKDVLETERELARVQGELDSITAQRQTLANETEKILLFVEYRPKPSIAETGAFQPLAEAWRNAGRAFAESLSAALLFIVQIIPWLFIVLPLGWLAWKGVRRLVDWRRARRTQAD